MVFMLGTRSSQSHGPAPGLVLMCLIPEPEARRQVMIDPVLLVADGFTYERSVIEKWFAEQAQPRYHDEPLQPHHAPP